MSDDVHEQRPAAGSLSEPHEDAPQSSAQLRSIGRIVLVCGLIAAAIVYWISGGPVSDDAAAFVHTRNSDNQMTRMMGHFGLMMTDWQAALWSPIGRSLVVLAVSGLLAGYFFRVATVQDEEQRDRERGQ
jgi:hypothetical protein